MSQQHDTLHASAPSARSAEGELFDVPRDIVDMFVEIGLERPEAVALLPAGYRIAQKLHDSDWEL